MHRVAVAVLSLFTLSSCITSSDEFSEPVAGAGAPGAGGTVGALGGSAGTAAAGAASNAGTGAVTNIPGGAAGTPATAGTGGSDADGGANSNAGSTGTPMQGDAGDPGNCDEAGVMVGITAAHNAVRETVEPPNGTALPPLEWSCEVAGVAQAYADELAATLNCDLVHSASDYGENLFWSSGFQPTPQDVVDAWASEEPCYTYDVFPDQCSEVPGQCDVCGHYTQMVWRNTERVGCGMAECGQAQVWVCNYDPPGNYLDQYPY